MKDLSTKLKKYSYTHRENKKRKKIISIPFYWETLVGRNEAATFLLLYFFFPSLIVVCEEMGEKRGRGASSFLGIGDIWYETAPELYGGRKMFGIGDVIFVEAQEEEN